MAENNYFECSKRDSPIFVNTKIGTVPNFLIVIQAAGITLLALSLYLYTLAPTLLWGDDAELQRLAYSNEAGGGLRSYPLWSFFAHGFAKLPFGDPAWRVNLVSAVFAALAVGMVFITCRILSYSTTAAWIAGLALAVSHTFWMHAVRAEVYSLFLFVLAAIVTLLSSWQKTLHSWTLFAALILTGIAFLSHLLIVTVLPAIVILVICVKKEHPLRIFIMAIIAIAIGMLPYLINTGSSRQLALDSPQYLSGLLEIRLKDVIYWASFLSYQFLLLLPIGVWGLIRLWKTDWRYALFLSLMFCGNVGFALSLHVTDQYVFYLPSYLVFVLWIGQGINDMQKMAIFQHRLLLPCVFFLAVFVPMPVYRICPIILNNYQICLLSPRNLPYRDNNLFFLYPPKNDYYGARKFGETVMQDLPPNAAVLADWLPLQTLTYLQKIEGLRQDVLLMDIGAGQGKQLAWLLEQSRARPVFIADNGRYYDIVEIGRVFKILPFGLIYMLEKKTAVDGNCLDFRVNENGTVPFGDRISSILHL